jgi:hypothetical protein
MEYVGFMNIVSHTLLLGSEKELATVSPSPASTESASTASSSVQPPDVFLSKRAPAKHPPFRLDGKTKNNVLLKFSAARSE